MNADVALVILFNHKFEKNLNRLKEIYQGRFDHIFFIMPFYQGSEEQVIEVFGNSFFYQGYLAQALPRIRKGGFRHYMVIGDDLILSPRINQLNYTEYFKLKPTSGFIPGVFLLHDDTTPRPLMKTPNFWDWNINAVKFKVRQPGIEAERELPTYDEALSKLSTHGYAFRELLKKSQIVRSRPVIPPAGGFTGKAKALFTWMINSLQFSLRNERRISYPMVGSYSDILIIPGSAIDQFVHLSATFASLQLFVEMAIPTSLLLSSDDVVQEKELPENGLVLWEDEDISGFEARYDRSLQQLFKDFPPGTLYIHPVKLSRWR